MRFREILEVEDAGSSLGDIFSTQIDAIRDYNSDVDAAAADAQFRANNPGIGSSTGGEFGDSPNELPAATGRGNGRVVPNTNMSPLFVLNNQASRMCTPDAGERMQRDTIPRARRMAGFFGATVVVNDAIAKSGTSREGETQGSQHFRGRALDIDVSGYNNTQRLQLVDAALRAGFTGFGFGNSILHVDTGPRRHWAYGNGSYGGMSVADLGGMVRGYTPGRTTGVA